MKNKYLVLWHDTFEYDYREADSLEDVVEYVKNDRRYENYGRNGATIVTYEKAYTISIEPVEKCFDKSGAEITTGRIKKSPEPEVLPDGSITAKIPNDESSKL